MRNNPAIKSIKTLKVNERHYPAFYKEYKKSLSYLLQNLICQAKQFALQVSLRNAEGLKSFGAARVNSCTQNIAVGGFGKRLCLDLYSASPTVFVQFYHLLLYG